MATPSDHRVSIPRAVEKEWNALTVGPRAAPGRFDPAMVQDLPDVARRWLRHAIAPGTPLWRCVEIEMTGQIRLNGSWRPFAARQVIAPAEGFIWAAAARTVGLPIRGFDRYTAGAGEMRWKLAGTVPVMTADGADVTQSAKGRLAGEAVLVPTAFASASWREGPMPDTAIMERTLDGSTEAVRVTVGPDGALHDVVMERWGNPDGAPFGRYPFGVSIAREATFNGITIPSVLKAGWWHGTKREEAGRFFRATISSATFR